MKENRRIKGALLWLVLAGVMLIATVAMGRPASAAKAPSIARNWTLYYYQIRNTDGTKDYVAEGKIYLKNFNNYSEFTVIGFKSSNKKYTAFIPSTYDGIYVTMKYGVPRNGEKTKISFKVKNKGKTYKLSATVTIKKGPNPYKSIKIGKKNCTSGFNGYNVNVFSLSKTGKAKITIRMKAGYKLKEIGVNYKNGKYRNVKNNATISLKGLDEIYISYSMPKKHKGDPEKWRPTGYSYILVK